jgi:hypothetical protein
MPEKAASSSHMHNLCASAKIVAMKAGWQSHMAGDFCVQRTIAMPR